MPTPCQDVYSTVVVTNEILNGGFNQLFFNSTVEFAGMALKGFTAIGLPKLTDLLTQVMQIYEENKERLNQYDDGTVESFALSYEENMFDELDNLFSEDSSCFEDLIVDYIKMVEKVEKK